MNSQGEASLGQTDVVTALELLDFRVDSVTLVSRRPDGGKEVYRAAVTTDFADMTVFVKGYPESLQENIRTVVSAPVDIGLPPSYVVPGSPTVLVMERAAGRPLSRLLPVLLFRGVWNIFQEDVIAGTHNLGRYLGNLHSLGPESHDTPRGYLSEAGNYLEVPGGTTDYLDTPTARRIESLFELANQTTSPIGICHSDLSPHNVYYSAGDVALIDFGFQRKPIVVDRVLVELGITLMIRRLPYARSPQLENLLDEFRSGYRATNVVDSPEVVFHALMIGICLQLLERYAAAPKTVRARITRWTDRPILTDLVRKSLDATSKL